MKTLMTISNKGINTMMVNNATARHANVIMERTGSVEMGIMKSLLVDVLKAKMQSGTAHFWFKKLDGTIREAWGTTSHNLMANKINGNGYTGEQVNTVKFWDVEKGAFRSLRYENLIAVA